MSVVHSRQLRFALALLLSAAIVVWSPIARAAERVAVEASPTQPDVLAATAEPSSPGGWAIVVGATSALVPLGIGGMSMGFAESIDNRNIGFLMAGSGFITAPLLSHGVENEWGRGALFSLPSLVCEGVMIGTVAAFPEGVFLGTIETRTVFSALFTASAFFSIAGVVDAALAGDRREGRGPFVADRPADLRLVGLSPGVIGSPYGVTLHLALGDVH